MGRRPIQNFPKEDMLIAKRHMEKCSTSLITREIQIKTSRYHLTQVRIAIIKKNLQITNAGECVEKGNPPTLLLGM